MKDQVTQWDPSTALRSARDDSTCYCPQRSRGISLGAVILLGVIFALPAFANDTRLNAADSRLFRQWFLLIVNEQAVKPPNPRWQQRDCAGLVRFAVDEALVAHDAGWLKSNGLIGRALPAEMDLATPVRQALSGWRLPGEGGAKSNFALAQPLMQENTILVGRDLTAARPGDLLFFDQGEDQHVMIWTGRSIAYHTGSEADRDRRIKVVDPKELYRWKDSRWWPTAANPNFAGVYRFSFLSH